MKIPNLVVGGPILKDVESSLNIIMSTFEIINVPYNLNYLMCRGQKYVFTVNESAIVISYSVDRTLYVHTSIHISKNAFNIRTHCCQTLSVSNNIRQSLKSDSQGSGITEGVGGRGKQCTYKCQKLQ